MSNLVVYNKDQQRKQKKKRKKEKYGKEERKKNEVEVATTVYIFSLQGILQS